MKITREATRPFSNVVLDVDGERISISSCDIHIEKGSLKIRVKTNKEKGIEKSRILSGVDIVHEQRKLFPLDEEKITLLNIERKRAGVEIVKGKDEVKDFASEEYNIQNMRCLEQAIEDLVKQEKEFEEISVSKPPVVAFENPESNYFVLVERVWA